MNATLMKRLFRAIQSGSDSDVETMCRKVIDREKEAGHVRVAEDLEQILVESRDRRKTQPKDRELALLPTSRRDSAPLLQEVPRDELRHNCSDICKEILRKE
jgi:hypothetical protein